MLIVFTILWVVGVVFGLRSAIKWRSKRDATLVEKNAGSIYDKYSLYSIRYGDRLALTGFAGGLTGIILLIFLCSTVYNVLCAPYDIGYQEQKLHIMQQRYESQAALVRAELSRYPEYERAVIDKIDPAIVLSWPNLRTSETLMQMVKTVVELRDGAYDAEIELARLRYSYDFNRNVLLFVP